MALGARVFRTRWSQLVSPSCQPCIMHQSLSSSWCISCNTISLSVSADCRSYSGLSLRSAASHVVCSAEIYTTQCSAAYWPQDIGPAQALQSKWRALLWTETIQSYGAQSPYMYILINCLVLARRLYIEQNNHKTRNCRQHVNKNTETHP